MRAIRVAVALVAWVSLAWDVSAAMKSTAVDSPIAPAEVMSVVKLLEHAHLDRATVSPAGFAKVPGKLMAIFDPKRIYFFESDEAALMARLGPTLRERLSVRGDIGFVDDVGSLFRERVNERVAWIHEELASAPSFDAREMFAEKTEDAGWPQDRAAADAEWRRRLKAEAIEELLNDVPLERALSLVRQRYSRFKDATERISPQARAQWGLRAVAKLFDAQSDYHSAEMMAKFGAAGAEVGIGLRLAESGGTIVVQEVVRGGPSFDRGLVSAGDELLAIGQGESEPETVGNMTLDQVVDLTKGPAVSRIQAVFRPRLALDPSERLRVALLRRRVTEATRVSSGVVSTSRGSVGVIQVPTFYAQLADGGNVSADLAEGLQQLQKRGVAGVVLDLRGNGGGYLLEAVECAGLFLGNEVVAHLRHYDGSLKKERSQRLQPLYSGPLVLITDRGTASGAELFAGALQAHGRALVLGSGPTHGLGTVQQVVELRQVHRALMAAGKPTGSVRFTIQKFYLPSGAATQSRGIVPDITVPSLTDIPVRAEAGQRRTARSDELEVGYVPSPTRRRLQTIAARVQGMVDDRADAAWLAAAAALYRRAASEAVPLAPEARVKRRAELAQAEKQLRERGQALTPAQVEPFGSSEHRPARESPQAASLRHIAERVDVPLQVSLLSLAEMAELPR